MADHPRVDEQAEDGNAGSADLRKALALDDSVTRTAVVGTCVILWVLAVFMIVSANRVKAELAAIRSGLGFLISTSGGGNINGVTIVDRDGTIVYRLRRPNLGMEASTCSVDGCTGVPGECVHGSSPEEAGRGTSSAKP